MISVCILSCSGRCIDGIGDYWGSKRNHVFFSHFFLILTVRVDVLHGDAW